jgi:hypothetical protein
MEVNHILSVLGPINYAVKHVTSTFRQKYGCHFLSTLSKRYR